MMENRSFDHYFGWHPNADAMNAGLSYPNLDHTQSFPTHRLTPDFQGCGFRDPNHGWDGGRFQYNGGKLDGFYSGNAEGTGSDEYALGYYLKADLPFIPHAAAAYQLYDRYFCSIMASTYPNRHYQMAAQNGGQKSNEFPTGANGFEWETIFDRALSRGLEVGYYVSDLPVPALYGQRGLGWVRPASQFYTDAAEGRLPPITFIDPPFKDGGGGNGISADEHPHGDVRLGQAFMSDVVHAFIEAPQYRRGALFVNYDEWGGFFDHVKPQPRPRRPRQPRRPHRGLVADRLPHPRGGGLAVHPPQEGRPRQPHDVHPRVDPEADLLPLRARLPEQAPPLRVEHRPQLRLLQAQTSIRRSYRTRRRSRRRPARWAAARSARSSTTWSRSRPPACSTGSATRSRTSPTTRSSATRTGCGARRGRERKRAPIKGPWFERIVPPANPAAGSSVLQSVSVIDGRSTYLNTAFRAWLRFPPAVNHQRLRAFYHPYKACDGSCTAVPTDRALVSARRASATSASASRSRGPAGGRGPAAAARSRSRAWRPMRSQLPWALTTTGWAVPETVLPLIPAM